jgi:hypothetical protein
MVIKGKKSKKQDSKKGKKRKKEINIKKLDYLTISIDRLTRRQKKAQEVNKKRSYK